MGKMCLKRNFNLAQVPHITMEEVRLPLSLLPFKKGQLFCNSGGSHPTVVFDIPTLIFYCLFVLSLNVEEESGHRVVLISASFKHIV